MTMAPARNTTLIIAAAVCLVACSSSAVFCVIYYTLFSGPPRAGRLWADQAGRDLASMQSTCPAFKTWAKNSVYMFREADAIDANRSYSVPERGVAMSAWQAKFINGLPKCGKSDTVTGLDGRPRNANEEVNKLALDVSANMAVAIAALG